MKNNLKFNNGKFRIMLVGDPHESYKDSTEKELNKISDYLALQYKAIETQKPDLVILMGDNAKGNTPDELRRVLQRITMPYQESNIPFAFVIGNHDLECELNTIKSQYDVYRTISGCLLPDEASISEFGDYNLTINSDDKPAFNLWFMYSGNRASKEYYSKYDFVSEEQIKWYKNREAMLRELNSKSLNSMVFQHIPVPEEFRLLKERSCFSMLTDGVSGQNEQQGKFYSVNKKLAKGYMGEAPCTSGYNSGEFDAWKDSGNVIAAFFGHDHLNDFIGMVDGIVLGQCKLSGFRQYGDGLMQGVRIIDIHEDNTNVIDTKMVYYRDIIGNDCNSITGREKILRDRTSEKLDAAAKIIRFTAPVIIPLTIYKIIKKLK